MSVDKVIMIIMAVFFALGAVDRITGYRTNLGREFEKGFSMIAPIAMTILGLICIAPVVANIIRPIIVPAYSLIGADPAMFSGTFFAPDSGGYAIADELSDNVKLVEFSGLVVGATIGAVLSFTIVCAYAFLEKEDIKYFAIGILSGLIFDPVACFFGGIALGISPKVVIINLIPVLISSLLVVLGLYFVPKILIKGFSILSVILLAIITIGLVSGAVQQMTGLTLIEGIRPISEAFTILGNVIVVIVGAMTLFYILRLILKKPLGVIGKKIGVNDVTLIAIIISLTTIPPVFEEFKNMNPKGKVLASAAAASIANMFGAHLGFAAAVSATAIGPMLLTKTIAGLFAFPTAIFFYNRLFKNQENE